MCCYVLYPCALDCWQAPPVSLVRNGFSYILMYIGFTPGVNRSSHLRFVSLFASHLVWKRSSLNSMSTIANAIKKHAEGVKTAYSHVILFLHFLPRIFSRLLAACQRVRWKIPFWQAHSMWKRHDYKYLAFPLFLCAAETSQTVPWQENVFLWNSLCGFVCEKGEQYGGPGDRRTVLRERDGGTERSGLNVPELARYSWSRLPERVNGRSLVKLSCSGRALPGAAEPASFC